MSISIKAPVGDTKRITKPNKPNEKFKTVANKKDDVELVQLMLNANGYSVAIDGKNSAGLVKAIKSFQKAACGFKKPDGIVDPGMRTWKAGLPKLQARIAENERTLADRVYVMEGGKKKLITKKEFEKQQAATLKAVNDKATSMHGQAEVWLDFCADAEATMLGQETVMMQLVEFSVRWANEKANPPYTPLYTARSEAASLQQLTKKNANPNWDKIMKQEKKAVKAYNAGVKAFKTFIDARISTASGIVGKLELVRDTSATVVEAYLTVHLVATKGMSPAKANALAAASTEAVKGSAGLLGEHLAGNEVKWKDVEKVVVDTAFAGAAGFIGGKMSSAMATKFAGSFAVKLSPKLGKYIATEGVEKFMTAFLKSGAGQAFFENAAKETFLLSKTAFKKGTLTKKDFEEALLKAMTAGVMKGAAGKAMEGFSKAIPKVTQRALNGLMDKNILKNGAQDIAKLYDLDPKFIQIILRDKGDDIGANVIEKVSGKYVEGKVLETLNGSKGTETDKQLAKELENNLRKSKALQDEMRKLMYAEVAKQAKKLEKVK